MQITCRENPRNCQVAATLKGFLSYMKKRKIKGHLFYVINVPLKKYQGLPRDSRSRNIYPTTHERNLHLVCTRKKVLLENH